MYKLSKYSYLNTIYVRNTVLNKNKINNKKSKQILIFLRSPKHFNVGKRKVFASSNYKLLKLNFIKLPIFTLSYSLYRTFLFNILKNLFKLNLVYNISSLKLNTKIKIQWQ